MGSSQGGNLTKSKLEPGQFLELHLQSRFDILCEVVRGRMKGGEREEAGRGFNSPGHFILLAPLCVLGLGLDAFLTY